MKTSERIGTMVHAFVDPAHRDEVRRLAKHVELLETVAKSAADFLSHTHFEKLAKLRKALAALEGAE